MSTRTRAHLAWLAPSPFTLSSQDSTHSDQLGGRASAADLVEFSPSDSYFHRRASISENTRSFPRRCVRTHLAMCRTKRSCGLVWYVSKPFHRRHTRLPVHTGEQTTAQSSPPSRRSWSSSCVVCVQLHHNIVNYKAVITPYRSDPVPARAGTFSFSFSLRV